MKIKGKTRTLARRQECCPTTEEGVADVKKWIARMSDHTARAASLAGQMSREDLMESDHRFWALAKYAENVEESIIKLDKINPNVYPVLVELSEEKWKGLKGMRQMLAHQFWKIDPDVLWETVTSEFRQLKLLLDYTIVSDDISPEDGKQLSFAITFDQLNAMPCLSGVDVISAGNMLMQLTFAANGKITVCRLGHFHHRKIVAITNDNWLVTDWKGNYLTSGHGLETMGALSSSD